MKRLLVMIVVVMSAVDARAVVYNPRLGVYYPTITQAVAAAAAGDRLHVSTGIYAETVWLTNELNGLVLSGGYATNGITRLHGAYSVITRGATVAGGYQTVTLEYFALTGNLNRTTLRAENGVCVTCAHCRITGNRGSVFLDVARVVDVRDGGRLVLTNTVVSGNSHPTRGGGAIVTGGKSLLIVESDSTIEENAAPLGGGVAVDGGGALVVRGVVRGNTATSGGGVYVDGGSVLAHGSTAAIGAAHGGNMATNIGGGIYAVRATVIVSNGAVVAANRVMNDGGGVYAEDSRMRFVDATLGDVNTNFSNYALGGSGGGIYLERSTATFERAVVAGNVAGETLDTCGGGGIALDDGSHVSLRRSVLQGNRTAASSGGGGGDQRKLAWEQQLMVDGGDASGEQLRCRGGRGGGLFVRRAVAKPNGGNDSARE